MMATAAAHATHAARAAVAMAVLPVLPVLPVPPAPLRRRTDWRQRLRAFAMSRHREPFAWGQNDCALFAADAVAAVTGHDFGASFRGAYASASQALRVLAPFGGLQGLASAALGQPVGGQFAGVGDVCLVHFDGRECLGVCNGVEVLGPGASGMAHAPLSAAALAWRVAP